MRAPSIAVRLTQVYLICQAIPVAVMIAYLVGSLIFTGAQVLPEGRRAYGAAWSAPVFPVPAWLIIVPSAVGLLLVWAPLVAGRSRTPQVATAFGFSIAATIAAWFFSLAFPIGDGVVVIGWRSFAGYHLVGSALSGLSTIILAVFLIIHVRAHDRARREEILRQYNV